MKGIRLGGLALVISGAALLACGGGGDQGAQQRDGRDAVPQPSDRDRADRDRADRDRAEILPLPASPHGVVEHPELVGATREAMVARFGPPTRSETVRLSEGVSEMQIELLNHYPPGDPASRDVVIREDWWSWDGHSLVLWSHQVDGGWVVLETVQFTEDVEF